MRSTIQGLKDFGVRLREQREKLGLTQVEFAILCGVRRVAQYLYEIGERAPTVEYLLKAKNAGLDLSYALLGKSKHQRVAGRATDLVDRILAVQKAVSEIAVDKKGRPLPIEEQLKLARVAYEAMLRGETVTAEGAKFIKNLKLALC